MGCGSPARPKRPHRTRTEACTAPAASKHPFPVTVSSQRHGARHNSRRTYTTGLVGLTAMPRKRKSTACGSRQVSSSSTRRRRAGRLPSVFLVSARVACLVSNGDSYMKVIWSCDCEQFATCSSQPASTAMAAASSIGGRAKLAAACTSRKCLFAILAARDLAVGGG